MKVKLKTLMNLFIISSAIGCGISYNKLYLFHIVLIEVIFVFIYFSSQNKKYSISQPPTRFHNIFFFMFFYYCLSIFWSIKPSYTIKYLFYIFCGLSIVIILVYYIKNIEIQNEVFKILSIVFAFEIFFSILEAFTKFRLPISPYSKYLAYFGREYKLPTNLGEQEIKYLLNVPTGFRWNPNNLAVTLLIIFPFFILAKNNVRKYFGIISILILIIRTNSRAVFLSLIFMYIIYIILINKNKYLIYFTFVIVFILIFTPFSEIFKNSSNINIRDLAYSFDAIKLFLFDRNITDNSIGVRKQLLINGLNALKDSNFLGVGGGCSSYIQEQLGLVNGVSRMHNFWIEILVDVGAIFFIIFFSWYLYVIYELFNISISCTNKDIKYYSKALFLSNSSFIFGAISLSSAIYFFPMWIMFGFSIATINNYKRYKNENFNFRGF